MTDLVPRWLQRRWSVAESELAELARLGSDRLDRMVADLSLPSSALRLLASRDSDEGGLLLRRLAALRLDPDDVRRSEPATFRDLQRLCALCESRRQCARDLAKEDSGLGEQDWRDYCPNAGTLNMLAALDSYSHARG